MSTVKEIIDEFCDRINQPREATIYGSSQPAARQFLSLFKFIGNELLTANTTGWFPLKRIYTFTTQTNVANYQLPGDFFMMLGGTQWSVTNQLPLSGPLSNAALAFRTYGAIPAALFTGFQVNGPNGYIYNTVPYTQKSAGYFQISPAGANNTDENVIAYISSNFVWPRDWVAGQAYSVGDIRTGVANMYICTDAITTSATRPSVTSGTEVDGDGVWTVYHEPYTVTNDGDFCLFDDDLMIEGLRWAWYRAKKQDYTQERADWEMSVRTAIGRQNGASIVNAGYDVDSAYDFPNIPIGGWNI